MVLSFVTSPMVIVQSFYGNQLISRLDTIILFRTRSPHKREKLQFGQMPSTGKTSSLSWIKCLAKHRMWATIAQLGTTQLTLSSQDTALEQRQQLAEVSTDLSSEPRFLAYTGPVVIGICVGGHRSTCNYRILYGIWTYFKPKVIKYSGTKKSGVWVNYH